ncbi:NAD-dependent epimerase/dehydratase family protein [Wenxinia saemankumensis]|uniref:Predicted dehydrogenase n=1 Tax=Wenxinia saemankumensis TaxID=1447782 RepID=A0A1M6FZH0_9RHOB|nr:NAD-dependent epimerase/dehydratase family protein [Wenxinia saemankumensis]SHJ03019.1 Predicted dehydrogenase [Wenxinia saemankumensis]
MTDIRAAILGAGYIADWHAAAIAATPGVRLAAVCDPDRASAEALANRYGAEAFTELDALVASGTAQAVHILTPPALHADLAVRCLDAGLHVLVEKPAALSVDEFARMEEAATRAGRHLAAGHNFLGLPRYGRLKRLMASGALGRVSDIRVDWALPLAPLRSGPYGLWLLNETRNLLWELGPHPVSLAQDLAGRLDVRMLDLGQPARLPGGAERPQSWRVLARAGAVDVTLALSLVETIDTRLVTVRGSGGRAVLDYASDTLTVARDNTAELVANPLMRQLSEGWEHLREGARNAAIQGGTLNRRSPYAQSFRGMVAAFHDGIRSGDPDRRFAPGAARAVTQTLAEIERLIPPQPAPSIATGTPSPTAMVIGGTGYIGRALTRALAARGTHVRVVSRGRHGPFDDIADRVETVRVSLSDEAGLTEAMRGIDIVYNLARALEDTWEAALRNDVGTALRIARAAHAAEVDRLVYTGTIASYDMSDPRTVITEETGFGEIEDRNLYARSKAECERRLMEMHESAGLPLVVARPGIVVGGDGPLQHWGIGRWHGPGAVTLWGDGRNVLPFVLVEDVVEGLILCGTTDGIEGESFNLVGGPILSARDYFQAIHDRLHARIRVRSGYLHGLWATDAVKWALKRHALGRRDAVLPSLADWKSRAHLARFDNALPKRRLGWSPEETRARFLDRAIDGRALFGL